MLTDDDHSQVTVAQAHDSHSSLEVLRVFLKLGVASFGGPIAHIGYFRDEIVDGTRLWRGSTRRSDWRVRLRHARATSELGRSRKSAGRQAPN